MRFLQGMDLATLSALGLLNGVIPLSGQIIIVTGGLVLTLSGYFDDVRCTCGEKCNCSTSAIPKPDADGFFPAPSGIKDDDIYPIDPIRDRWRDSFATQPIKFDPLALDLNRDGNINLENAAFFDLNANGFHEYTRWINETDAFLILDVNGNGIVDNGSNILNGGDEDDYLEGRAGKDVYI